MTAFRFFPGTFKKQKERKKNSFTWKRINYRLPQSELWRHWTTVKFNLMIFERAKIMGINKDVNNGGEGIIQKWVEIVKITKSPLFHSDYFMVFL